MSNGTSVPTIDDVRASHTKLADVTGHLPVLDRHGLPWTIVDINGTLRARPRACSSSGPGSADIRTVANVETLLSESGPLTVEVRA